MRDIQPKYLSFSELLQGRLFRIPNFQRAYSWTARQREDLFEDLSSTYQKGQDEDHFMATIVCLRKEKKELDTNEFQYSEIVDGQQRITTLIILLKAVCLALDTDVPAQKRILTELQDLLVKPHSDELLLLQTNHDRSHYFANFLRNGEAPSPDEAKTVADKELLKAIKGCEDFVAQWYKDHDDEDNRGLILLTRLLKNHLFFLFHEIDHEKIVYTVFEVLNNRGLNVSWLDRLKSSLMGIAFELPGADSKSLIKDLHNIWADIYKTIGLEKSLGVETLRFGATLFARDVQSKPLGEADSVDLLRDAAKGSAKQVREVANWLLKVTKECESLGENRRLDAVTRVSQARLLAVAIKLRNDLSDSERENLLGQWERVSFRIYGLCRYDARTGVGDYVRLAWRVNRKKLQAKEISKGIESIGKNFSIENAVDELENADCYDGWREELRYFMFRYEEHLSDLKGMKFKNEQWERIWRASTSDSIEHIWPQKGAPDNQRNRLGNLVLLPPRLNSSLQNKAPADKAGDYTQTGLLIAQEVADTIKGSGKWNKKTIDERERKLVEWARQKWAD